MTPREAIDELKARAAVVHSDFDDTADEVNADAESDDPPAPEVVAAVRSDLADLAREMAALEMGIASLEAFGGVDEATLAPAMREAMLKARRDFPAAAIVLVGFARMPYGAGILASPVLRVGRAGAETVAGLIRRGFLVWGRE